jgi:hypothetical protein
LRLYLYHPPEKDRLNSKTGTFAARRAEMER